MGIPKSVAVAVSGLVFAGGAALAAAPASAQAMVAAPQHVISGGAVPGGGGVGPGPRPRARAGVVHRRVVVQRPVFRHHRVCHSCHNRERFHEFDHFAAREHRRAIILNRNRNFSESDTEQFQRQRERQEIEPFERQAQR
jgi:hypothetical protein